MNTISPAAVVTMTALNGVSIQSEPDTAALMLQRTDIAIANTMKSRSSETQDTLETMETQMRAKITTSLGFSLLTATALVGLFYLNSTPSVIEMAEFVVLSAGALSLLALTWTRPAK